MYFSACFDMNSGEKEKLTQETSYSSVLPAVFDVTSENVLEENTLTRSRALRLVSLQWTSSPSEWSRVDETTKEIHDLITNKNALNFKKGSRQEAPATNPDSRVSGMVDTSSFPACRTAAISVTMQPHTWFKQEVFKILSPLQTWSWGDTAIAGAALGQGGRERNTHTHKEQKHAHHYSSQVTLMPLSSQMLEILIWWTLLKGLSGAV